MSVARAASTGAALGLAALLASGAARAQPAPSAQPARAEPTASERELSREQFAAGVAAAREGRWDDARAAFERAHELDPQPLILFNLAGAQGRTGRLITAAESYRRFLALARDDAAIATYRDAAASALAQLEGRIPHVRLAVVDPSASAGAGASAVVRLDGRALSPRALELPLPVDPGPHLAEAARAGAPSGAAVRAQFTLGEGERREVRLLLAAAPVAPSPRSTARVVGASTGPRPPPPWYAHPAFWTIAAVVVVGAGVGIPLAVVYGGGGAQGEAFRGTIPPYTAMVPPGP